MKIIHNKVIIESIYNSRTGKYGFVINTTNNDGEYQTILSSDIKYYNGEKAKNEGRCLVNLLRKTI